MHCERAHLNGWKAAQLSYNNELLNSHFFIIHSVFFLNNSSVQSLLIWKNCFSFPSTCSEYIRSFLQLQIAIIYGKCWGLKISSRFSSSTNPFKLCFGHLFWENLLSPHARLCEYVLVCHLNQKYEVWMVKISFVKGENPCNVAMNYSSM